MEHKPRWAEMCARILQQCEVLRGGRANLAAFLGVPPDAIADWVEGKEGKDGARVGPPRAVFEKAMEVILAEHDRRASMAPGPRRRRTDH
jgi:hypothetical protein